MEGDFYGCKLAASEYSDPMTAKRPLFVAANWKMHTRLVDGRVLVQEMSDYLRQAPVAGAVDIAICPPFPYLHMHEGAAHQAGMWLGAQDCHAADDGAFTGDVSAAMLKDVGCDVVILGHSERRALHQETDAMISAKLRTAVAAGLHVILCVGEALAQRELGKEHFLPQLETQLLASLPEGVADAQVSVAYEPIWAIGTGKTATLEEISEVHVQLHHILRTKRNLNLRVLYGGSVKANNALEILSLPVVDGVLVGGASLKAPEFCTIINAAQHAYRQR